MDTKPSPPLLVMCSLTGKKGRGGCDFRPWEPSRSHNRAIREAYENGGGCALLLEGVGGGAYLGNDHARRIVVVAHRHGYGHRGLVLPIDPAAAPAAPATGRRCRRPARSFAHHLPDGPTGGERAAVGVGGSVGQWAASACSSADAPSRHGVLERSQGWLRELNPQRHAWALGRGRVRIKDLG
jgi:hypothetical protein